MNQLVIAEKPSVAKEIAGVLGANQKQEGHWAGNGYLVSWCVGHLLELASPEGYDEKYLTWRYADLPIFPEKWKLVVNKNTVTQLKVLDALLKRADVDTVICATDAGREGELIFRHVYHHCRCKKPVKRLWINSMENSAIAEGFRKLKDGVEYEKLYQAAYCRQRADWLVGMNFTRLFTTLYGVTLNVGRVQTPTLAMIVERAAAIAGFQKEAFYIPEIQCGGFTASGEKHKSREEAERIQAACQGGNAVVAEVDKKEKSVAPPKLYDLTTLQREANRKHGYTASETLDHVQSLYEKKLATYPRTDSRYITTDMAQSTENLVRAFVPSAPCRVEQIVDNTKVTDHHAILPTQTASGCDVSQLADGERKVLQMLIDRLICAVGEKHVYEETAVKMECSGHEFRVKGKTIVRAGWKTEPDKDDDESEKDAAPLPALAQGQVIASVRATVKEGFTSPPKPFTEDTLLAAMETAGAKDMPEDAERKGLGTPATRADIIKRLTAKHTKDSIPFVERSGKKLLPTEKAINLIAVLPEHIKSPLLTAEWEYKLKQVERGEMTEAEFMNEIRRMVGDMVSTHSAPDAAKKLLFSPAQSSKKTATDTVGPCPCCGGQVIVREHQKKKGYLCENRDCRFIGIWEDNYYFTSILRKPLSKDIVIALLRDGKTTVSDCVSKNGKKYSAPIVMTLAEFTNKEGILKMQPRFEMKF